MKDYRINYTRLYRKMKMNLLYHARLSLIQLAVVVILVVTYGLLAEEANIGLVSLWERCGAYALLGLGIWLLLAVVGFMIDLMIFVILHWVFGGKMDRWYKRRDR